jgi:hypothetical protein
VRAHRPAPHPSSPSAAGRGSRRADGPADRARPAYPATGSSLREGLRLCRGLSSEAWFHVKHATECWRSMSPCAASPSPSAPDGRAAELTDWLQGLVDRARTGAPPTGRVCVWGPRTVPWIIERGVVSRETGVGVGARALRGIVSSAPAVWVSRRTEPIDSQGLADCARTAAPANGSGVCGAAGWCRGLVSEAWFHVKRGVGMPGAGWQQVPAPHRLVHRPTASGRGHRRREVGGATPGERSAGPGDPLHPLP